MRDDVVERRAAEMDGEHPPAEEVANDAAFADIAVAQRLARRARAAVGAHRVGGAQCGAAAVMLGVDLDAGAGVAHRGHAPARPDRHRGAGGGFGPQHALDEHLRDAVRQLGRAPRAGQRPDHLARRPRRRQAEAGELMLGVAGEIGDVGRVVRRQALGAHLLGKAEPAVVLHGAGLGGVGRREPRRRGLLLQQNDRNVAAAELDGEHQPARPAADNDDGAVVLLAHGIPRLHDPAL